MGRMTIHSTSAKHSLQVPASHIWIERKVPTHPGPLYIGIQNCENHAYPGQRPFRKGRLDLNQLEPATACLHPTQQLGLTCQKVRSASLSELCGFACAALLHNSHTCHHAHNATMDPMMPNHKQTVTQGMPGSCSYQPEYCRQRRIRCHHSWPQA